MDIKTSISYCVEIMTKSKKNDELNTPCGLHAIKE